MEMKTEMNEDILATAQKRRAGRLTSRSMLDPSPKREVKRGGSYPSEHILRIDNFTTGPETPSPAPSPVPFLHSSSFESNSHGFSEVAGRSRKLATRKSTPMFVDDIPNFSRNLLPPHVNVEVQGQEVPSLINTSSHISLISTRIVNTLGLRKDFIPDTTVPPSPFNNALTTNQYLIEGKLRYVELSFRGNKYVNQLYVVRDLPADLVLGVDFLKKAQVKINFQDSSVSMSSGKEEIKMSFLTTKELQPQTTSFIGSFDVPNNRAYSSNF